MKHRSLTRSIHPLADTTGVSSETAEFATEIASAVARSGAANDRLPSAVAAGCLYAATRAVGADRSGNRKPKPNRNWNPELGLRRRDNGGSEMTICKAASITPASLRKHSREAAAIYLDSDTGRADGRTRERLSRLTLR